MGMLRWAEVKRREERDKRSLLLFNLRKISAYVLRQVRLPLDRRRESRQRILDERSWKELFTTFFAKT
jgi:hypothetical protein